MVNRNATSPWPFVGMSGMACAFFLYAASPVAGVPWWGTTLLLKGPETLIVSAPSRDAQAGEIYRNTAGTPGLGTAGSGDVLAGVIGGLLAQGNTPSAAAVWGVHLHALAGEAAAGDEGDDGMIASDVVDHLPRALRALRLAP